MLWLEEHHPEAVPADRYTLTSTNSIFDPNCLSQSGNSASISSWTVTSVSTPSTAKLVTPASSASNMSLSGSSASCLSQTPPSVTTLLTAKSVSPASSAGSVSQSGSSAAGSSRACPSVTTPSSAKSSSSSDGTDKSILS